MKKKKPILKFLLGRVSAPLFNGPPILFTVVSKRLWIAVAKIRNLSFTNLTIKKQYKLII